MDSHIIDLVQAGVDGELDAAGRAELERVLAENEDARRYHDELCRIGEFLRGVPDVAPPQDFRGRILDAIELPGVESRRRFGLSLFPAPLRYGLAAAAGVLLTLAVVGQRGIVSDPADLDDMVGTISPRSATTRDALAEHLFEIPGARGEAVLSLQEKRYALQLAFDADEPLEFRIDLERSGLEVDAITRADQQLPASLRLDGGSLAGHADGDQGLLVWLRRTSPITASTPAIGLTLSRSGSVIHTGRLDAGR